jgi:hypothetical protein
MKYGKRRETSMKVATWKTQVYMRGYADDWIDLAQDTNRWRVLVDREMNLLVP